MPSYMKEENNKLYFVGKGEIIYYVPNKYFELNVAKIIGEYVDVFGIFTYGLFDGNGKQLAYKQFKCPTMVKCKPSKIEKANNILLEGYKEESNYRLLHFSDGSELLSATSIPQETLNVEKFINLVKGANLPAYLPYNELQNYFLMNASMNGFSYGVSNQIIGLVISELCRDENNLSNPFRFTDMKNNTAYKMIPMNKVPKYTSPYTALTSENPDEAIAGAMLTTGKSHSPLEKVMMN